MVAALGPFNHVVTIEPAIMFNCFYWLYSWGVLVPRFLELVGKNGIILEFSNYPRLSSEGSDPWKVGLSFEKGGDVEISPS